MRNENGDADYVGQMMDSLEDTYIFYIIFIWDLSIVCLKYENIGSLEFVKILVIAD